MWKYEQIYINNKEMKVYLFIYNFLFGIPYMTDDTATNKNPNTSWLPLLCNHLEKHC